MVPSRFAIPLLLLAAPLPAQSGATAGFVVLLGRDTVALERATRSPSRLEGDLFLVSPRATRIHYVASLDARGQIVRFEVTSSAAVDTPPAPARHVVAEVKDGSIFQTVSTGGRSDTVSFRAAPGAVPFIGRSTALLEQMTMQWSRAGTDSLAIDTYAPGARGATPNYVARRGADSVAIDYGGLPFMLRVDRSGRVLGLSGMRTTQKFLVDRVAALDLERLSESFVTRERQGAVAGPLSPRDTVRAKVGDASLLVDYGRPAKRGRVIMGNVVPWNEVWRTGANQATQFTTTADLLVGNTVIPAGTYTLWTLPSQGGVQLIVNRQTGQWGTIYDPGQDLVRLNLKTEELNERVERFTIRVVSLGKAGELRFDWDKTRWILPFRIR